MCFTWGRDFSCTQTPGFKSLKFTVFMFSKFYGTVFCYYLLIVSVVLLYIDSSVWANEAKFWRLCSLWDPWPGNVETLLPRNLAIRWKSSRVRGDYAFTIRNPSYDIFQQPPSSITCIITCRLVYFFLRKTGARKPLLKSIYMAAILFDWAGLNCRWLHLYFVLIESK